MRARFTVTTDTVLPFSSRHRYSRIRAVLKSSTIPCVISSSHTSTKEPAQRLAIASVQLACLGPMLPLRPTREIASRTHRTSADWASQIPLVDGECPFFALPLLAMPQTCSDVRRTPESFTRIQKTRTTTSCLADTATSRPHLRSDRLWSVRTVRSASHESRSHSACSEHSSG